MESEANSDTKRGNILFTYHKTPTVGQLTEADNKSEVSEAERKGEGGVIVSWVQFYWKRCKSFGNSGDNFKITCGYN